MGEGKVNSGRGPESRDHILKARNIKGATNRDESQWQKENADLALGLVSDISSM
jgi:hypothetical protein